MILSTDQRNGAVPMSPKFKSLLVHDLIHQDGRLYEVVGVYWGATGHEDAAELQPRDRHCDLTLIVPIGFIRHENIFRAVDHEAAKNPVAHAA